MRHPISELPKPRWSAQFYLITTLTILLTPGQCLTETRSLNTTTPTPVETPLVPKNSTDRDPRQLFSLLKNLLRPQPSVQSTELSNYPSSSSLYPYQQQHHQQYPLQNPIQYQDKYPAEYYPTSMSSSIQHKIHSANINPTTTTNSQQYPLNYPSHQHVAPPLYDNLQQPDQSQQAFQTVPNPGGESSSSLLSLLTSVLGSASGGANNAMVSNMLGKLGIGGNTPTEDLDLFSLLNFGSIEGMLGRVNRFDKLQCIPRMICQMVAKRNEDARIRDSTSTTSTTTTTTTTTERSKKSKKRKSKFFKLDGVDTALDQFVKFLDLMQLKDWSLYPYVKGMTEGHTVTHPGDCAHRFSSCPFSEDQLVYYFNNYNGGFFQSFRSGRVMGEV